MSEKDKNRNERSTDFLRYRENKMTDKERHAFEKNLQKDPFNEEATEGFDQTDPLHAEEDLTELRDWLSRRTSVKKRTLLYRIAAVLAALVLLTPIVVVQLKRQSPEQIAPAHETPAVAETPVIMEQKPEAAGIREEMAVVQVSSKKSSAETRKAEDTKFAEEEFREEEIQVSNQETIAVAEIQEPEKVLTGEKAKTAVTFNYIAYSERRVPVRGRVVSSEDNLPIPGASITVKGTNKGTVTDTGGRFMLPPEEVAGKNLVADFVGMESKEFIAESDTDLEIRLDPSELLLNETVVVGYGKKEASEEQEYTMSGYTPPQPEVGQAAFDRYIREHIKRPDPENAGRRAVVVLDCTVEKDGRIDTIQVIRSPGVIFSSEAIRLVREGPAWKSAVSDGENIRDKVRIRIVFR